jgi:hypothetical protein
VRDVNTFALSAADVTPQQPTVAPAWTRCMRLPGRMSCAWSDEVCLGSCAEYANYTQADSSIAILRPLSCLRGWLRVLCV